jgi:hypothetical protein
VTALVAVRGVGTGEEDAVAPAPIPTAPAQKPQPAEPGARGRARTRPRAVEATPAKPAEKPNKAEAPARPKLTKEQVAQKKAEAEVLSVAKSLGQNDVVLLLFSRPGAADDTAARQAVQKLDGTKGLQIYTPNFEDLDNYRPILAGVGVAQMPAIVIVKPGHKAELVEGFVDQQSLRQQVEDSLR